MQQEDPQPNTKPISTNQKTHNLKQIKRKEKLTQSLMQKGYTFDTINLVIEALDFSQSEETLDILLQDELEKAYNKFSKKYSGKKIINKTIETLMRKGYQYDKIKSKLEESGIEDGTEEIE